ncbi:MAG: SGNH/GDSL hydrolase family protein [Xanthomonadales bacterium]|nr:SGNH/GDSL hydrolase family protein [Xanthomonadales bacterium]
MGRSYLALGDSYTIGEAVAEDLRWPVQLVARLNRREFHFDPPEIIATTGWTTDELAAAMDAKYPVGTRADFDLVSLLIGVNNQYRGRALDEYREQFAALLERALALAGDDPQRVLLLAIPDWGVTPFGAKSGRDTAQIARELDAFNSAAAEIARGSSVRFVDTSAVSREHGAEWVAEDGLHPSAALYAAWAEAAEIALLGP